MLSRLREGPALNVELAEISPTANDHIGFLRNAGYAIECIQNYKDKPRSGLFTYVLHEGPAPMWDITVRVELKDGEVSYQTIRLNACTARQAKSAARNRVVYTKVIEAQLVSPPLTGREWETVEEGH